MKKVAVIGGGIAGLGSAYLLQKYGCEVTVFEQQNRVGGRMQTFTKEGFTWDSGAQFMLSSYSYMMRLMNDLGLKVSSQPIPSIQGIVLSNNRISRAETFSPISFFRHPDISMSSKLKSWKLIKTIWQYRDYSDYHYPERMAPFDTKSLRVWADQEIGADAVDFYLSLPMSSLFFWTPEETPWWFPVMLAIMGKTKSFKMIVPDGGMGAVPEALARRLKVHLRERVQRVETTSRGTVIVRTESGESEVDRVIVATPAPITLELIDDPIMRLGKIRASYIRSTNYSSNLTTAIAYNEAPELQAYGVSVPLALNHKLAAIGWDHLKGRIRALEGGGLAVAMPTHEFSVARWGDANTAIHNELIEAIELLYPKSSSHVLFANLNRWKFAMPKMEPGRYQMLDQALNEGALTGSTIFTCGDYWMGPTTEHALGSALRTAREVLQSLEIPIPDDLKDI